MKIIKDFFIKYMALIISVIALVSLFAPQSALWISTSWINYLLMVVMFGMGLTLKPESFVLVFKCPKDILCGVFAQYTIMPLLAFGLSRLFGLDAALTAGVILVGTCPGGTASNVITYFAKGDIALSVSITSVNTLLAPILTPLVTYFLLNTTIEVNMTNMLAAIINVILVPIVLGFILNRFFNKITQKLVDLLPVLSVVAICMIIATVVAHNAEKIYTCGFVVLSVVVLHNLLGYLCGFTFGKILKMKPAKIKAFSIEIGMQNSGLATSLAGTAFPSLAMATVPGAIFSVWHNISGAILAEIYRHWDDDYYCEKQK
ncbi:MAG: bile acid:sodium symporter family protein [Alphaproteobacteria bacterium]|nr:bile acid:sodium symporter family protein [Alphaproteobacteria bacterium]